MDERRTRCGFCNNGKRIRAVNAQGIEVSEQSKDYDRLGTVDCWHCDGTGYRLTPEDRALRRSE